MTETASADFNIKADKVGLIVAKMRISAASFGVLKAKEMQILIVGLGFIEPSEHLTQTSHVRQAATPSTSFSTM